MYETISEGTMLIIMVKGPEITLRRASEEKARLTVNGELASPMDTSEKTTKVRTGVKIGET